MLQNLIAKLSKNAGDSPKLSFHAAIADDC
jgi:hypothetical protein